MDAIGEKGLLIYLAYYCAIFCKHHQRKDNDDSFGSLTSYGPFPIGLCYQTREQTHQVAWNLSKFSTETYPVLGNPGKLINSHLTSPSYSSNLHIHKASGSGDLECIAKFHIISKMAIILVSHTKKIYTQFSVLS